VLKALSSAHGSVGRWSSLKEVGPSGSEVIGGVALKGEIGPPAPAFLLCFLDTMR
jgi:hypothetical protein